MSATTILTATRRWKTDDGVVGLTEVQVVAPATNILKKVRIVMVQADKDNNGCISFGSDSGLAIAVDTGGRLTPGQAVTLPIDLVSSGQELWLIGDKVGQAYHVSYFGAEVIC